MKSYKMLFIVLVVSASVSIVAATAYNSYFNLDDHDTRLVPYEVTMDFSEMRLLAILDWESGMWVLPPSGTIPPYPLNRPLRYVFNVEIPMERWDSAGP